jgi:hypothetical protein
MRMGFIIIFRSPLLSVCMSPPSTPLPQHKVRPRQPAQTAGTNGVRMRVIIDLTFGVEIFATEKDIFLSKGVPL